jgi:hypothetical protein
MSGAAAFRSDASAGHGIASRAMSKWPKGFSPALRAALTSVTGALFFPAPDAFCIDDLGASASRVPINVPGPPVHPMNCTESSSHIDRCAR